MNSRVIIAGGSGFLGQGLAEHFQKQNLEVIILTRSPSTTVDGIKFHQWDGKTSQGWSHLLEGATSVINLTGRSVNCLHTEENKKVILSSRIQSVNAVAQAIQSVKHPPPLWLQAASLAVYGDGTDEIFDESSPETLSDFPSFVCREWEQATNLAVTPQTRKVILRIGIVLGKTGGALQVLSNLTRAFLGGAAGSGKQYISWMHQDDFHRAVDWFLKSEKAEGAYNLCSPHPETNAELMKKLRNVLHRPWSPPVPEFMVRFGARYVLKTDANLALQGRRCLPRRLIDEGFEFKYPKLQEALKDLLSA